jgi:hypothetical protein
LFFSNFNILYKTNSGAVFHKSPEGLPPKEKKGYDPRESRISLRRVSLPSKTPFSNLSFNRRSIKKNLDEIMMMVYVWGIPRLRRSLP